MNKYVAGALLTISLGMSFNVNKVNAENTNIKIETNNRIKQILWHNDESNLVNNEEVVSLFDTYDIDINEASNSLDVYVQEEYVEFDEKYIKKDIETISLNDTQTQEYLHNKGYIKFITKAYALGFYDGSIVYHIVTTTEQQKSFKINKKDDLIIRHGENSVTLNIDKYQAKGESCTPYTIYMENDPSNPTYGNVINELSPNYSFSNGGVYYTFPGGFTSSINKGVNIVYDNTKVTGDYYIVATDTTEVQPVYVHNRNLLFDSISISFGPIGVGITADDWSDIMEGSPMTLKGYKSRIEQKVYEIKANDWNFDQRYYFENEGIKSSTLNIEDLSLESSRLRCGYIENEFINLSPNRYNAGDAYLEITSNLPIYEYSVNLSYWSSSEYLYPSQGDYAYIQYLDSNGNWNNYYDILSSKLSSKRKEQKEFTCDFVEGVYSIRIIAHKETPNTDRNKGRICIGNMNIVTYNIH